MTWELFCVEYGSAKNTAFRHVLDIFLKQAVDVFIWKIAVQVRIHHGNCRHLRVILLYWI